MTRTIRISFCHSSQNNISAKKQIPLKDLLSFSLKTPFLLRLREKFHKVFLLHAPIQKERIHSAFHGDISVFHTCFCQFFQRWFQIISFRVTGHCQDCSVLILFFHEVSPDVKGHDETIGIAYDPRTRRVRIVI